MINILSMFDTYFSSKFFLFSFFLRLLLKKSLNADFFLIGSVWVPTETTFNCDARPLPLLFFRLNLRCISGALTLRLQWSKHGQEISWWPACCNETTWSSSMDVFGVLSDAKFDLRVDALLFAAACISVVEKVSFVDDSSSFHFQGISRCVKCGDLVTGADILRLLRLMGTFLDPRPVISVIILSILAFLSLMTITTTTKKYLFFELCILWLFMSPCFQQKSCCCD